MTSPLAHRRLDLLSLATFVGLGLPDGMLGTAWPSMRASLHAPIGALGLVLLASTAGSVVIAAFVGRLLRRTGVAALLAAGLSCAAVGAAGFAVAPVFGVVLGVAVLFGLAAGALDGGLNTAIGLSGRNRLLNLLHGAYGVGTAIGPLIVTIAIVTGSWRPAYIVLLAADLTMAVLWVMQRRSADFATAPHPASQPAAQPQPAVAPAGESAAAGGTAAPPPAERMPPAMASATPAPRSYRGAVVAGITVFFVYTGLEVAAGQWETSFGRGHLHLSATEAGIATFGYWAALTVVRIGLGLLRHPPSSQSVVRGGSLIGLVATALIWWQPDTAITVLGFVILGGALAGMFPALIALTPARIGAERAQHVIAWEVGAAAAGGAGISALVGLLIGTSGLAVLGPALVVLAVLLIGVELVLSRMAPVPR